MKNKFLNFGAFTALLGLFTLATSCSDNDSNEGTTEPSIIEGRYITIAGAVMGTTNPIPGDGNGGTIVYSISKENAKDATKTYDVFENGFTVPSNRTARLQSSQDGFILFNIAYTGTNGGEFSKYTVGGGQNFTPTGGVVNISQYAGTSPRWVKLFDGDKTGVAVNVTTPTVVTNADETYKHTRGSSTILTLDLVNSLISKTMSYEIPLTIDEEVQGHHIFRLDAPVLNAAKNKLIIGTWMRKTNPVTGINESTYIHLGSKSVVVDYPSLENPVVITSTVGFGDTSGYRSSNSFVGDNGAIYQATQRDASGSHILKINQNNQYDNSFVLNLDTALGLSGTYIENWKYAGNGKAVVAYMHDGAAISALSGQSQSFLALVDLNSKTAKTLDLPYSTDMYFFQYQGYVVDGYDVYVTAAPVGQDGRIYIINSATGVVTTGAKLTNKPGNHFIGAF
jgi:hypothetical protein